MSLKNLVVHMDAGERTAERLGLAVTLARRFGARLTGLFAEVQSLGPSVVSRRAPGDLRRAADEGRHAFDAATKLAGITTQWLELPAGEYAEVVGPMAICCRYFDLAIFGQHDPEDDRRVPQDLVERVLVESGRPVLVVPWAGHYRDVGKRVLVGWNASREAARALNDAMPLMEAAEAVTVLAFQQPGAAVPGAMPHLDVTEHLRAHDIAAVYERVLREGAGAELGVVDSLLNRCFDDQCDLIVTGGYQHFGLPLLHRGARSTRDLLRSMIAPVLLSS